MNYLVIGLGSMGQRRIRCLNSLNEEYIAGFDIKESRRKQAEQEYHIKTFDNYDQAIKEFKPDALIISVPPDAHHIYIDSAIKNNIHFFVEASVVDTGLEKAIERLRDRDIVAAPSCTLLFHPAIKLIREALSNNELGSISNIVLHSGQYLPDWHTYEKVSDFYVSNKETGGAREIVPFELTWLTHLIGYPGSVLGSYKKTIEIEGAEEIDDTYNFILDYDQFMVTGSVDVVSRAATRRVLINGSDKQLIWDWSEELIQLYDPQIEEWEKRSFEMKEAVEGYDKRIGENMYIEEIQSFVEAVKGTGSYPNTLEKDLKVLQLLYAIEESNEKKIKF